MGAISFSIEEAQEVARALAAVAAADGAILGREASFLDEFAMTHSIAGLSFIPQPLDHARLGRIVADADKRREVIRLCLRMALVDGDYAEAVARAVARIAAAFAIPDDELAALTASTRG